MKNWKTTLAGCITLLLFAFQITGYLPAHVTEAFATIAVAFGLISSADAQRVGRQDKVANHNAVWIVIALPALASCTVLRQVDYDEVARSFSQKAIRQIFDKPDFTFGADSIYLEKKVPYSLVEKVIGKRLAYQFTAEGQAQVETKLVFTQAKWQYLGNNIVLITFKRIRKNGKSVNLGRNIRRVRSWDYNRICRKDLVSIRKIKRDAINDCRPRKTYQRLV